MTQCNDGLLAEQSEFDSGQGQQIFLYSTGSRLALGPMQSHIQWFPRAHSPGVMRPVREANYTPPSSTKVKNCGAIPPLPHMPSWYST
jgi:hypothetical protein